jgi:hypothetical protein
MENTKLRSKTYYWVVISVILFFGGILGISKINPGENPNDEFKTPKEKIPVFSEVKVDNIKSIIEKLENYGERSSWEKQNEAILWAKSLFDKLGMDSWIETYEKDGKIWPNLFARIKGRKNPSELIMVIAHIDSISDDPEKGAPGADDNGSGVAVLLETARILTEVSLDRTVMFAIFTNEEPGAAGSKNYARQAKYNGLNIELVINLDILGYNRPTSPLYWSAVTSQPLWKQKAKTIIRMAQTFFAGFLKGRDLIKVAGREADRRFVYTTSKIIRQSAGLKVEELVSDDCG